MNKAVGKMKRDVRITFMKRKDCIKKKTMELATLCDIKACALIIGPEDGKLETWPQDLEEVKTMINAYYNHPKTNQGRIQKSESKKPIIAENGDNLKNGFLGWDEEWIQRSSIDSLRDILCQTELKLKAVTDRMEFLKNAEGNEVVYDEDLFDIAYYAAKPLRVMEPSVTDIVVNHNEVQVQPLQSMQSSQNEFSYGDLMMLNDGWFDQFAFERPHGPVSWYEGADSCSNNIGASGSDLVWSGSILEETKADFMSNNGSQQELDPSYHASPLHEILLPFLNLPQSSV